MLNGIGYGFQSNELRKAIRLIQNAIDNNHHIVLAFTGNMISSGLRKSICLLAKTRSIAAIVTNGAGVEEDIIKTFGDYEQVEFQSNTKDLIKRELFRIGNLAVDHKMYDKLWDFLEDNFDEIISNKRCDQSPGEIAKYLGKATDDVNSYLFWTYANNIDVYCPTFHDGAIGDFLIEHREKNTSYRLDYILENVKLSQTLQSYDQCGIIILGGGTSKHFALNNSILRGGYDWSIVVSTAIPFDGSDSGGDSEEAKTWGKLKENAPSIRIFSDATLVFPSLVENGFNVMH